jgi:UDP-glucose 4-epimerase
MKVLLTGGSGFIGSYVCEKLIEHGHEPIIFDHHKRDPKDYPVQCEVFLGDICDEVAVTEAMAHCDSWIHLAACLGSQETIFNPIPAARTNLLGGLNILQSAAQYKLPGAYIAVGNRGMYNTYTLTKSLVEDFVVMYNRERGTSINTVRAVNAYGPRQLAAAPFGPGKVRKITPAFICRALSKMPIEVYGGGVQTSDMVYVGDVAEALVRAMEEAAKGNVFNKVIEVGPRDHKTVYEVAELVREYCADITGVAVELKSLPMRPGETANAMVTADYHTLKMIGMNSADLTPLEKGMRETVQYFVDSKGTAWDSPDEL